MRVFDRDGKGNPYHKGKGKGGGQFTSGPGVAGMIAPQSEIRVARAWARRKIENAPIPSAEAITKARAELAKAKEGKGRPGGDARGGNAADRRRQRRNLFMEAGGEKKGYVVCHGCGLKMHWDDPNSPENPKGYARFERGKIFVKCQGGGYQLTNLLPECFGCNRHRNDHPIRKEISC